MTTKCTNEIEIFPIVGHLLWKILLKKVIEKRILMSNIHHNEQSEHSIYHGFSLDIFTLETSDAICVL